MVDPMLLVLAKMAKVQFISQMTQYTISNGMERAKSLNGQTKHNGKKQETLRRLLNKNTTNSLLNTQRSKE